MQLERQGQKGFFAEPVLRFLPQAGSAFPVLPALMEPEKSDPDPARRA